jgi:hypothetical protein
MSLPRSSACRFLSSLGGQGESRITEEAAARRHAGTAVSSLVCQVPAFRAPPGTKHDLGIFPFLSLGRPPYAGKARLMLPPKRNSGDEVLMHDRNPFRRSCLTLLLCLTAQHPAAAVDYAKWPPWQVAGIDFPVGVPSTATLSDWQLLSGPGIVVHATDNPPFVRIDDTSNVVISGVDFSLHGGAYLFFVNSPNPTVTNCKFGGPNLKRIPVAVIFADKYSPGLTVSYNTIDGAGDGNGSSLVRAGGTGTTTLTYNWLTNFPQHVLETTAAGASYSIVYKYNFISQGAKAPGAHLNYLQFTTESTSSSFVDVEYNTSYQTRQVAAGEGYQFGNLSSTGLVKNVTFAYNVMIAAGSGIAMSYLVHAGGSQNAGVAHDNYFDATAAYGWGYPGSFTGWTVSSNYLMTTGALLSRP